jgi:diguanylate cyclase (GGDEF)-like protein/PAS domain S-box-containing protein
VAAVAIIGELCGGVLAPIGSWPLYLVSGVVLAITLVAFHRAKGPSLGWRPVTLSMLYIASVTLMIVAQRPGPSGLSVMYLLPVVVSAVKASRTDSAINVVSAAVAFAVVNLGRHATTASTVRGAVLYTALGVLVAVTVHNFRSRLQEAIGRQKLSFQEAPIGKAIVSLDGRLLEVNGAFCRLVGYSDHELRSMTFQEITHPDDLDADLALVGDLIAGRRRQYSLDKRYIRKDGGHVFVSLHVVLAGDAGTPPYLIAQVLDVTEERRREEELRFLVDELSESNNMLDSAIRDAETSRGRLTALVEHSRDPIAVLDADQILRYASPAYKELFGVDPAEAIGSPSASRTHPEDRERLAGILAEIMTEPGAVGTYEIRVMRTDGEWRHVEVTASNHLGDPAVEGIVCNCRDVTDRVIEARELSRIATHDSLTGLANRALLMERLVAALSRTRQSTEKVALLYIDIDHFKAINDNFGHAAGDRLLTSVAECLRTETRPQDTVARLGGDELVVLIDHVSNVGCATALADRLRDTCRRSLRVNGTLVGVTLSIGVALSGGHTAEALLAEADAALYRAKRNGRDRTELAMGTGGTPDANVA